MLNRTGIGIKIIFTLILIFFIREAFCSDFNKNKYPYLGFNTSYGFIIAHSKEIASVSNTNPWGVEIDFGWYHTSEKAWQYCFCFPSSGFMLTYHNFNNPEVLGYGLGVVPYIQPNLSANKPVYFSIRAGLGLVYLNKIYHPITNPENNFFSTHLSFIALINLGLNVLLNENLNLKLSGNYNHISNGSIKQPNKGMNFPMASIGIDYTFDQITFPEWGKKDYNSERKKGSVIRLSIYSSMKEINKEDKKQYPVFGLSGKFSHTIGRMNALTIGSEWTWDGSLKEYISMNDISDSNHNRISITAGHELLIGKVNFYQDIGVYIYSPFVAPDPIYQRYGIEYFVNQNFSVGLNLKAHRHVADLLDIRITLSI